MDWSSIIGKLYEKSAIEKMAEAAEKQRKFKEELEEKKSKFITFRSGTSGATASAGPWHVTITTAEIKLKELFAELELPFTVEGVELLREYIINTGKEE